MAPKRKAAQALSSEAATVQESVDADAASAVAPNAKSKAKAKAKVVVARSEELPQEAPTHARKTGPKTKTMKTMPINNPEIITTLSHKTGFSVTQTKSFLAAVVSVATDELGSDSHCFKFPGLFTLSVVVKPPTESAERNAFGKQITTKAKPERFAPKIALTSQAMKKIEAIAQNGANGEEPTPPDTEIASE